MIAQLFGVLAGLKLSKGLFRKARPDVATAVGVAVVRQRIVDGLLGCNAIDIEAHPVGAVPVVGEHRMDDVGVLLGDFGQA